ncbi:unnamed protein product [Cunninghamella blakesleeana]
MSSFHSDDLDNNWNDNSSTFQDLLIENVDQMEFFSAVDTRCKKRQKRSFNGKDFQIHHEEFTLQSACSNETINSAQLALSDNTNIRHYNSDKYNVETKNTNVNPLITKKQNLFS